MVAPAVVDTTAAAGKDPHSNVTAAESNAAAEAKTRLPNDALEAQDRATRSEKTLQEKRSVDVVTAFEVTTAQLPNIVSESIYSAARSTLSSSMQTVGMHNYLAEEGHSSSNKSNVKLNLEGQGAIDDVRKWVAVCRM
jgi:hypothetical protein